MVCRKVKDSPDHKQLPSWQRNLQWYVMRLMGEPGEERPLDRYCRLKEDMRAWYMEARDAGLTQEQIETLEPYYLPNCGVPSSQEDMMEICMDEKIAHFNLSEANATRKIVA